MSKIFKPHLQFQKNKSLAFHPRKDSSSCAFRVEIHRDVNYRRAIQCMDPTWPGMHVRNLRDYKSMMKLYGKARRKTAATNSKQEKTNRGRCS